MKKEEKLRILCTSVHKIARSSKGSAKLKYIVIEIIIA